MNLYLITRNDGVDYDQYDGAVVAAPNEEDAKALIEQDLNSWTFAEWKYIEEILVVTHTELDITITLIGTATDKMQYGIVIASFNPG